MRYEFIDAEKAIWPVRITCRVLEVSRSGYYDHNRVRKPLVEQLFKQPQFAK